MKSWTAFWIALAAVIVATNINQQDAHDVACVKAGGFIGRGEWYQPQRCMPKTDFTAQKNNARQ